MKKLYPSVLLLLFVFSFSKQVTASHIIGSDLTYTCTANMGIYEVTLTLFRDCSGVVLCEGGCGAACPQTLSIKGVDGSYSTSSFGTVTLSLVNVRDFDIKPTCPTSKNGCTNMGCIVNPGTFTPSTEVYTFKGMVNLGPSSGIPTNCCNVRFSWELCCRNGAIQTGAASQNFYTDAVINRCYSVSPCNSAPQFTSDPYDIVCGGEPVIYNNGAVDPDHDSLSFEFTPSLQGFNSPVTYQAPWSYTTPMPYTGSPTGVFPAGIHCDPYTGDIMFTPGNGSNNFTGILATDIKQWKNINGVPTVIGRTRRDIQIVVGANCPSNNAPRLITNPPLNPSSPNKPKLSWEVCEGAQLCFDVTSKDTDSTSVAIHDTTYLSWDKALEPLGATFLPNYTPGNRKREDSYQFCWTPPVGSASTQPYIVVIKNNDSRCPLPGRNTRGFSIKVNPRPRGSITKTPKACGKYQLSFTNAQPAFPIASVKWKIAKAPFDNSFAAGADTFSTTTTPILNFAAPGKYLIEISLNSNLCSSIQYDTLLVDTMLKITAINDTVICNGGSITLNATASYGSTPYSFRWFNSIKDTASTPLNSPSFGSAGYNVTPAASKTFTIQLRDATGCRAYDSVVVSVNNGIKNTALTHIKCNGQNNGSIVVNMWDSVISYQYRINSGAYQSSKQFTGLAPGTYTVEAKDNNNCMATLAGLTLTQPTVLTDTLTRVINNQSCVGQLNGQLTTTAKGGTSPYRYSLDSITFKSNGLYANLTPGTYKVIILDSQNCYTSVTQTITPADSLYQLTSTTNPNCFGIATGEIRTRGLGGVAPYTYRLGTSGTFANDSVFENLLQGTYTVYIKDQHACITSLTKSLTAPPQITSTTDASNPLCYGANDGVVMIHADGGNRPYQYRLGTGGVFTTDSSFTTLGSGTHTFYIKDATGCLSDITTSVYDPLQIVANINKQNPSCNMRTDGRFTITAVQGKAPFVYSMNGGAFDTTHTYTNLSGNTYTVTVKDNDGCLLPVSVTLINPPLIVAGSISGNTSVVQLTPESYAITPQVGLNYVWGIVNGTIISGQHTPGVDVSWDSAGIGQIGVAIYSDTTCGDTANLTVTIGGTGLFESAQQFGLDVYPNPTSGVLNINLKTLPENRSLKLYDIHGRIIVDQELKLEQQLNLEHLSSGIYLLKIGDHHGQIIKK